MLDGMNGVLRWLTLLSFPGCCPCACSWWHAFGNMSLRCLTPLCGNMCFRPVHMHVPSLVLVLVGAHTLNLVEALATMVPLVTSGKVCSSRECHRQKGPGLHTGGRTCRGAVRADDSIHSHSWLGAMSAHQNQTKVHPQSTVSGPHIMP